MKTIPLLAALVSTALASQAFARPHLNAPANDLYFARPLQLDAAEAVDSDGNVWATLSSSFCRTNRIMATQPLTIEFRIENLSEEEDDIVLSAGPLQYFDRGASCAGSYGSIGAILKEGDEYRISLALDIQDNVRESNENNNESDVVFIAVPQ